MQQFFTELLLIVKSVCLLTFAKFVWVVKTVFSSLRILWEPRQISSNYKFLPFFLTIVVVLAIAACNHNTPQQEKSQIETDKSAFAGTPIETKMVSNTLGEVEVPLKPQRVVVLEENIVLDSVLALGIKPVGVVSCRDCEENFRGIPSDLLRERTFPRKNYQFKTRFNSGVNMAQEFL